MQRSSLNIMWSETLIEVTRTSRLEREVFQLTEVGWEPPVDVFETETGLLVIVALPGVQPTEVETIIGDGELKVRGIRRWPTLQRAAGVRRIELPHGRFERRLPLPQGSYRLVGQDHANGCLVLTLKRLV